jgi:ribonuclease Z
MRTLFWLLLAGSAFAQSGFEDGNLHVVLCGTGSPLADPDRASACTAIVAGKELVLIDVGPGSWRKADLAQLPLGNLTTVLLTHFHSDHMGDLGEAITMSWVAGRAKPLDVYGPPGVEKVVNGFLAAYTMDSGYRVEHHTPEILPPGAARAVGRAVDAGKAVFERNGLKIVAFEVNHEPVRPAYGYRIEYRGRKVVVTGDTSKCEEVAKQAEGADLLIHDSLSKDMVLAAAKTANAFGQTRRAKMARDIVLYHATPVEAAETAAAAKVKTLVLTHMVPALRTEAQEKQFLRGVAEAFGGKVVLAKDGMRFDLTAEK